MRKLDFSKQYNKLNDEERIKLIFQAIDRNDREDIRRLIESHSADGFTNIFIIQEGEEETRKIDYPTIDERIDMIMTAKDKEDQAEIERLVKMPAECLTIVITRGPYRGQEITC